jgi:hypothetical protein
MKNIRKSLSNKIRFEVFRRDSFTCQYCGRSAPDIVLNVDHINPVSKGGKNDIFNLITSCFECNSGKRAKKLSSETEMSKQKKQLDILNERRIQLDMLLQWKTGLLQNDEDQAARIGDYLFKKIGDSSRSLSDDGLLKFKNYLKKLSAKRLIEIIDEVVDQLSSNISYFGLSDKTYEIVFSIIHAKYLSETADHESKMKYLLKQLNIRFFISDDDLKIITNTMNKYLIKHDSVMEYIELQKMSKNDSSQEFYDKIKYK